MYSVTFLSTVLISFHISKIVSLAEVVFLRQRYSLFLLQYVFPLLCTLLNFVSYLPVICKMHTAMRVDVVMNACYFYHILLRIKIVLQNIPVLNLINVLFVVRKLIYPFKPLDGQKK
jgi:hypothetical protein